LGSTHIPDLNGDEYDLRDETWCLYDGELIDDELRLLRGEFAGGARILALSDRCHGGTVTKMVFFGRSEGTAMRAAEPSTEGEPVQHRYMPLRGNYHDPHKKILAWMRPNQSPNHDFIGMWNPVYDAQRSFTI
jgi:hypothetical protein